VQSSGKTEVTGANVLVAIFNEQDSQAVFFLGQQEVSRLDVVNYISHGIAKGRDENHEEQDSLETDGEQKSDAQSSPLDSYASNLNELAAQGKISLDRTPCRD
jgi:ATP-dependent Clp protease ATP-binding subunit ClpA